jgi:P-type E1-E2 ATPase
VVATSLIKAAGLRGLTLSLPTETQEVPGEGIAGMVDGRQVAIGGKSYLAGRAIDGVEALAAGIPPGAMSVLVEVEGTLAGAIVLADRIRDDAPAVLAGLRAAGVHRIVLASGDRRDIAAEIGTQLGVDLVEAELPPEGKVAVIKREAGAGAVMMVGDGVNDAPALAAADVGVAMGARGTAASSEAAGVVLLVDELAPLARAIVIAKRTRAIALQSVFVGLGLSIAAMLAAAFGLLPPVQGALLQEAIDVAVILNALRALR